MLPGGSETQGSNWMTSLGMEEEAMEAKRKAKQEAGRMRKRAKLLADGSWVDNNTLLPAGWMMKGDLGTPTGRIISPDGFTAPSLRLHLKRLLQQGSSEEAAEVGLVHLFVPTLDLNLI